METVGCAVSCRQEMMREVDRGEVQEGDGVRHDVGYTRDRNQARLGEGSNDCSHIMNRTWAWLHKGSNDCSKLVLAFSTSWV